MNLVQKLVKRDPKAFLNLSRNWNMPVLPVVVEIPPPKTGDMRQMVDDIERAKPHSFGVKS
jgi:hypothetical protein